MSPRKVSRTMSLAIMLSATCPPSNHHHSTSLPVSPPHWASFSPFLPVPRSPVPPLLSPPVPSLLHPLLTKMKFLEAAPLPGITFISSIVLGSVFCCTCRPISPPAPSDPYALLSSLVSGSFYSLLSFLLPSLLLFL
eukprot:755872-Hanusia_phi.AAC.3